MFQVTPERKVTLTFFLRLVRKGIFKVVFKRLGGSNFRTFSLRSFFVLKKIVERSFHKNKNGWIFFDRLLSHLETYPVIKFLLSSILCVIKHSGIWKKEIAKN
jgi:hypothetical protein